MNRKAFHLLLKKYLDGKCSPQEKELIDQWYKLLDEEGLLSKQTEDLSLVEDRIWQRIQENIHVPEPAFRTKIVRLPAAYKWIAAVLLLVAGIILYTTYSKPVDAVVSAPVFHLPEGNDFYTKTNHTNTIMLVDLMDKSIVKLQPNASLSYPKQFAAGKREVYLEGAASFKVTKNAASPFLVYTGTIVTQVLGTSFTITKANNHFEVAVLTGKVAVYEEGNKQLHDKGGVVITPNEKVTYYADNHHFITSLVDNPVVVEVSNDSVVNKLPFNFDETPVSAVIAQLQHTFDVQIMTENEKINQCFFSGNISGKSLYGMLDIICQAIGANYEIRGTSIILTGKGCN